MQGSKDKIRLVDLLRKEILSNDSCQVYAIQYTRFDAGCLLKYFFRQLATIHCGLDDTYESYCSAIH